MTIRWLRRLLSSAATSFVCTLAIAAPAAADTIFSDGFEQGSVCPWSQTGPHVYCWINPAGGEWNTAANWREGQVPPADASVAIVLAAPPFTVTIGQSGPSVHDAQIDASLTIAGRELTVSGIAEVTGTLAASGAASLVVQGAGASFTAEQPPSIDGATLQVASGAALELPGLTSAEHVSLWVAGGGSFAAHGLVEWNGGEIQVTDPLSTLDAPSLADIDDSVLSVTDGGALALPLVTSWAMTETHCVLSNCVEALTYGYASLIDLPNLHTVSASGAGLDLWALNNGGGGGHIHLPALDTISTPDGGTVSFTAQGSGAIVALTALAVLPTRATMTLMSGGEMDATALTSVAGTVAMSGASNVFNAGPIASISGAFGLSGQTRSYPLVTSLTNVPITVRTAGSLTFGGLTAATNSSFTVSGGGSLAMPSLGSAAGATVKVSSGGSLSAAALTSLTKGVIEVLDAASSVKAPNLANVDGTLLEALSGGTLTLPGVVSYALDESRCLLPGCVEILAKNTGSTVALPNLHSVTSSGVGFEVLALDDGSGAGHVELPGLTTLAPTGAGTVSLTAQGSGASLGLAGLATLPDGATLSIQSGGHVGAQSLTSLAGNVSFSGMGNTLDAGAVSSISGSLTVAGAVLAFPQVTSLTDADLAVGASGSLTLAAVTTATNTVLDANHGGVLTMAALASAPSSTVMVATGGSFSAGSLTSLTSGAIEIADGTSSVATPSLADIDDTVLEASAGGALSLPAVTSYALSENRCVLDGCAELLADDTGSSLMLANLATIDDSGQALEIWTRTDGVGGGQIHLPGLISIATTPSSAVHFIAQGLGTSIDASTLTTYDAVQVDFSETGGGVILH